MNAMTKNEGEKRNEQWFSRYYERMLEVLLVVTVAPALVFGVDALHGIPIA